MAAAWCLYCMERQQPILTVDCAGNKQRETLKLEVVNERRRAVRARMDVADKEKEIAYLMQFNKNLANQLKAAENTMLAMKLEAAKADEIRLSLSEDISRLMAVNDVMNSRLEKSQMKRKTNGQLWKRRRRRKEKFSDQAQSPSKQMFANSACSNDQEVDFKPLETPAPASASPAHFEAEALSSNMNSVTQVQQQFDAIREQIIAYRRDRIVHWPVRTIVKSDDSETLELLGTGSG